MFFAMFINIFVILFQYQNPKGYFLQLKFWTLTHLVNTHL